MLRTTEPLSSSARFENQVHQYDDWSPIQYSASIDENDNIKALLSNGDIDPNYTIKSRIIPQVTALHIAARRGNAELIKILSPFVDINCQDQWGFSPLHYATLARQKDAVFALLSCGASAILESKNGSTALDLAKELSFDDIVDALISKINLEKDPLMPKFKEWLNHLGAGEYLPRFIEAGYDLRFISKMGLTPEDMECLKIPNDKRGTYRKIMDKYEIEKFYNGEESEGDDEDEDEEDEDEEDDEEDEEADEEED